MSIIRPTANSRAARAARREFSAPQATPAPKLDGSRGAMLRMHFDNARRNVNRRPILFRLAADCAWINTEEFRLRGGQGWTEDASNRLLIAPFKDMARGVSPNQAFGFVSRRGRPPAAARAAQLEQFRNAAKFVRAEFQTGEAEIIAPWFDRLALGIVPDEVFAGPSGWRKDSPRVIQMRHLDGSFYDEFDVAWVMRDLVTGLRTGKRMRPAAAAKLMAGSLKESTGIVVNPRTLTNIYLRRVRLLAPR